MRATVNRIALFLAGILLVSSVTAQGPFDYRRLFTKPTTPNEYWEAIKSELDVGRLDLASNLLDEMIKKGPTQDQLFELHEKEGIAPFLRLRLIRDWFKIQDLPRADRKNLEEANKKLAILNETAQKNAATIVNQMTAAVKAKRTDPDRIKLFVRNLRRSKEERQYALQELNLIGATAIPHLIEELKVLPVTERLPILRAMIILGVDTVPPILAALDTTNNSLKLNLLYVLRNRRDFAVLAKRTLDPVPFLWPLASKIEQNEAVREEATSMLAALYDVRVDKLPLPRVELTREAEKYYQHQSRLPKTGTVTLWRWMDEQLKKNDNITANQAETYYALRFSSQALQLDPSYEDAQIVSLLTTIDNGYPKPNVKSVLQSLKPDLLVTALRRSLRDNNTKGTLALIEALGEKRSTQASRPTVSGNTPLIKALYTGDRRIQLKAIEAILKIPNAQELQVKTRILEILRRAIAPESMTKVKPRILVAVNNAQWTLEIEDALVASGFEVVSTENGPETLRRIRQASDVDAILLDPTFPTPGFASMIGQLRIDADVKRLPIIVAAVPDSKQSREILANITEAKEKIAVLKETVKRQDIKLEQRQYTSQAIQKQLGRLKDRFAIARDARISQLNEYIELMSLRYQKEVDERSTHLKKLLEDYQHVIVVEPGVLNNQFAIQTQLLALFTDTGMIPLTAAEQKQHAEIALYFLSRMASGEIKGFKLDALREELIEVTNEKALSESALTNAIRALGSLSGTAVRQQFIKLILDETKPALVRFAASVELQNYFEKSGMPLPRYRDQLTETFKVALRQPNLDPQLQSQLQRLIGAMSTKRTLNGEILRKFQPELPEPKKP